VNSRLVESKDGKRIWTITERDKQFHCSGVRDDGAGGWTIAGHAIFLTEAAAVEFAESLCGLRPKAHADA
jgi:hypothetical protein